MKKLDILQQKIVSQKEIEWASKRFSANKKAFFQRTWMLMVLAIMEGIMLWKLKAGMSTWMASGISIIIGGWISQWYMNDKIKNGIKYEIKESGVILGVALMAVMTIFFVSSATHKMQSEKEMIAELRLSTYKVTNQEVVNQDKEFAVRESIRQDVQADLYSLYGLEFWLLMAVLHQIREKTKKEKLTAMDQESCEEVLKWVNENEDIKKYVETIKKEGRPIVKMEYRAMKEWMINLDEMKKQEMKKEACIKLYS